MGNTDSVNQGDGDVQQSQRWNSNPGRSLRDTFDQYGGSSGFLDVFRLEGFLRELQPEGGDDVTWAMREVLGRVNVDARGRVSFEELRRALVAMEQGIDVGDGVEMPKDAGHVFILLADLRKVSCDTWVVPTGPTLVPDPRWMSDPADFAALQPEPAGGARIRQVPQWPLTKPQPFVLNTHPPQLQRLASSNNLRQPMDLQWVHESLTLFLDAALRYCREKGRRPRNRRDKFLVALPLLASRLAPQYSGQLIREILPVLHGFAVGNGIDVALCTIDRTVFAVMQAERARWSNLVHGKVWADLSETLIREAQRLAEYASRDELALFLGAGVSIGGECV